jgi:hypothetical protein
MRKSIEYFGLHVVAGIKPELFHGHADSHEAGNAS